jgi:hypothetical protein
LRRAAAPGLRLDAKVRQLGAVRLRGRHGAPRRAAARAAPGDAGAAAPTARPLPRAPAAEAAAGGPRPAGAPAPPAPASPGPAPADAALATARARLDARVSRRGERRLDAIGPAPHAPAAPAAFARWLTRRIGACASWPELERVWLDYAGHVNVVHVTAAATRLARLAVADAAAAGGAARWGAPGAGEGAAAAAAERPELAKFATSLLCAAAERLPELDARGAANLLHSHAALQRAAPHSSRAAAGALGALVVAAGARAGEMRPQEAACTLWALGALRLGGRVPREWFGAFEAATAGAAASMGPEEASASLCALARLRRAPGAAWLAALLSSPRLAASGPRQVSTLLWGLATLAGMRRESRAGAIDGWGCLDERGGAAAPGPEPWLEAGALVGCLKRLVLVGYRRRAGAGAGRRVATTCSRLACEGAAAAAAWALTGEARRPLFYPQVLHDAGPADVTQAWLALSRLRLAPPPALRAPLLARTARLLPELRPRSLAAVLHSFARLGLDPGPAWWAAAAPQLACSALPAAPAPRLAIVAWALGRLQPGPELGPAVLPQLLASSLAILRRQAAGGGGGGFSAPELATLSWGLARAGAGAHAPEAWEAACVAAAGAMWQDFTSGELAMLLMGLGGLRRQRGGAGGGASSNIGGGGAVAGIDGGAGSGSGGGGSGGSGSSNPVWGGAALDASRLAMAGAPASDLTALAVAAARLGLVPGRAWSAALEDALVAALAPSGRREAPAMDAAGAAGPLAPRDAALLLWALSRLGAPPSPRLARALLSAAADAAPGMSSRDAAMALWSLLQMRSAPCGRAALAAAAGAALPEQLADLVAAIVDGQRDRLERPPPRGAPGRAARALAEARDTAAMLQSLARLAARPDPAWLDAAWRGALAPALPALAARAPRALVAALRGLRRLGAPLSAARLHEVLAVAAPQLPGWPPGLVAQLVAEAARCDGWLGSAWLEAACGALSGGGVRALTVRELVNAVAALARQGPLPDAAWATFAARELRRRADAGACGGDAGCEVRLARARHTADVMSAAARAAGI